MKVVKCLFVVVVLGFLAGCASRDIENREYVVSMGIDQSEEKGKPYRVVLELATPIREFEVKASQTQIIVENGKTIGNAIELIESRLAKELNFGHALVFVVGESFADRNTSQIIDWLLRRSDIPLDGLLAIGKPSAESVLRVVPMTENFPGSDLFLGLSEKGTQSSYIIHEFIYDFYRRKTEKGLDPFLPVVETNKDRYNIRTVAMMDKEKLKVTLNREDTRLFKTLLRKYADFTIQTEFQGQTFVYANYRLQRQFDMDTSNEVEPRIIVNVKMEGIVDESSKPLYDENWNEVVVQAQKTEEEAIMKLLTKFQKNSIDPLGFGLMYTAMHIGKEQDWIDWQALYPQVRFEAHVKIKLRATGAIK